MVAVRDQSLVPAEIRLDLGQVRRVGDRPQTVAETVLRGRREQRVAFRGALDDGGRADPGAVAAVGQQQRFEVGRGGTHQGRAVRDDVRHDVLVREDDAGGRLRQAQGADDAALQHAVVVLLVDVQARLGVGGQDAFGHPVVQGVRRLAVAGRRGRVLGRISLTMLCGSADSRWSRPSGRTMTSYGGDVTAARLPTRSGS